MDIRKHGNMEGGRCGKALKAGIFCQTGNHTNHHVLPEKNNDL